MAMSPRLLRPVASGYRYASLRQGLVAYWPMNETAASGDVLVGDETGRGNHLASVNSVPSATGKIGSGREFTAANSEYLTAAGNNADLRFMDGRSWTLSGWIYIPTTWPNTHIWAGRDNTSNREIVFDARIGGVDNALACQIGPGVTPSMTVAPRPTGGLAVNTWHFFAFSYDNATRTLTGRVNSGVGGLSTSSGVLPAGTPATSVNAFRLGARPWPGNELFFTGYLDEVAKWDRVLSSSELDTLYNNGNGISLAAPRPTFVAFPGVSNADAQDWVNRVYANGGTVSTSTANAVNSFCAAIDAAGIRDRFYRLNLFAGTGLNAALVPVYRGTSLGGTQYGNTTDTNVGPFVSGDYTLTGGLNANGSAGSSSKYLNTGLAPDDLPALSSVHLAAWKGAGSVGGSTLALIGSRTATQFWYVRQNAAADTLSGNIGHGAFVTGASADTTAGLVTMTRDTSGLVIYKDTTSVGTDGARTPTANANDFTVFAFRNTDGTVSANLAWPYAMYGYSAGVHLSSADVTAYHAAFAAFNTAMGRA